jgi:hypothetical protein
MLDRIQDDLPHVRRIARNVGYQHTAWDMILTAEEVLRGGSYWPYRSRDEAMWQCAKYFQQLRRERGL